MRIGHDDNFLSIEPVSIGDGFFACKVETVASASGRRFAASHDCLMLNAGDETLQHLAEFESLKSAQVEIGLSESGWLRFQRDARGWISVLYRIAGWKASAAMEGEIIIPGEFANHFCQEFHALLQSQRQR